MDIDRITRAFGDLTKVLIEEKVLQGNKWHTVDYYARKHKKGYLITELRISSIKRDKNALLAQAGGFNEEQANKIM